MVPTNTAQKKAAATFLWQGKDRSGRALKGELRATSSKEALAFLRTQGVAVSSVKKRATSSKMSGSVNQKDILRFTQQLHTMFKSGVPLVQALEMIERGTRKEKLSVIIAQVCSDVQSGGSLSASFARHPKCFDELYCNLIAAGEKSGALDVLFGRIHTYLEKSVQLKSRMRAALVYPCSILGVAVAVVGVLMVWVIPSFQDIFKNFGAQLPALTQGVIYFSQFLITKGIYIVVGTAVLVLSFMRLYTTNLTVQRAVMQWLFLVPLYGPLMRVGIVARFCRTLSTMVQAGVPILDAIALSGHSSSNIIFEDLIKVMLQQVQAGTMISSAMQIVDFFPEMVIQLTKIGEESGCLEDMLSKCADIYEEEVDTMVTSLSSLLEPAVIVVVGLVVGIVIAAMYLPVFSMGAAAS